MLDVRMITPETLHPEAEAERLRPPEKPGHIGAETPPITAVDDQLQTKNRESTPPSTLEIDSRTSLESRVDRLLAEGLDATYAAMIPEQQQRFKQAGEATTRRLTALLAKPRPAVEAVIQAIVGWLKFIPEANPYYLEQEAAIKAEKVISLIHPPTA